MVADDGSPILMDFGSTVKYVPSPPFAMWVLMIVGRGS